MNLADQERAFKNWVEMMHPDASPDFLQQLRVAFAAGALYGWREGLDAAAEARRPG